MLPAISPPISRSEWQRIWALTALVVLAAAVPYGLAYGVPAPQVFAGLLFNPLDGQSYFAKMQLGWHGSWAFTLPYTAEPAGGAFVYSYYLFLGHLARLTGRGVELTYHLARMLAGGFLLLSAYHFIAHFFETPRARLGVWLLYTLGSGLGWLAALLGLFTSDLWVAEAIPFLSVLSSSHFCLTAALMLWALEWALADFAGEAPRHRLARLGALALAVTAMAQTQPLALITLGVVLAAAAGAWAWRALAAPGAASWRERVMWPGWWPLGVAGAFSVPWVAYDAWALFTVFPGWNAQNLTPSPPAWDALLSGGAPLALAVVGGICVTRSVSRIGCHPEPRSGEGSQSSELDTLRPRKANARPQGDRLSRIGCHPEPHSGEGSQSSELETLRPRKASARPKGDRDVLILWLALNILMLYAPWSLQRRLSLGIWMPLVILAGIGWRQVVWARLAPRARPLALTGLALAAGLSNGLVYAGTLSVAPRAASLPLLFLTSDEAAGLAWLGQHAQGEVVLAGPEMGLFIPARAYARVIYGHPYETVNAEASRQAVEAFFSGKAAPVDFLAEHPASYIFYGPREQKLGALPPLPGWHVAFQQGEVSIYAR